MIRMPKEIENMIKIIEGAGFEAYAVGGCVRDSILGRQPEDWDLASNASRDILIALFPNASVVNKKLGVMRITEGEVTADIAAYRIDGVYKDYRRPDRVAFTKDIKEDLKRRDFTMNGIAVSPDRGVVDPYNGRKDVEDGLIRGIGNPGTRFEEDALRILRAVRFAAQLGFQIEGGTLQAMKERAGLLKHISRERILDEFSKTVMSSHSGKGLELMMEIGLLPYVLGEECMNSAGEQELRMLSELAKYIDHTEKELSLRLALVYRCFPPDTAEKSVERMGYSNEMRRKLQGGISLLPQLCSVRDKRSMKAFLSSFGTDCFRYLVRVWEQECRAYRRDDSALLYFLRLYDEVLRRGEPVFLRDLAVDGDDLIRAGIREGIDIGAILKQLLAVVHDDPEKNQRDILLKIAAKDHKS